MFAKYCSNSLPSTCLYNLRNGCWDYVLPVWIWKKLDDCYHITVKSWWQNSQGYPLACLVCFSDIASFFCPTYILFVILWMFCSNVVCKLLSLCIPRFVQVSTFSTCFLSISKAFFSSYKLEVMIFLQIVTLLHEQI